MTNNKIFNIDIDTNRCKACGICIAFCPKHVFDKDENGKPDAGRKDQCTGCQLCELRCPDFAIKVGRVDQ